jgi:hypothetical protein
MGHLSFSVERLDDGYSTGFEYTRKRSVYKQIPYLREPWAQHDRIQAGAAPSSSIR